LSRKGDRKKLKEGKPSQSEEIAPSKPKTGGWPSEKEKRRTLERRRGGPRRKIKEGGVPPRETEI